MILNEKDMRREKQIILAARIISMVFTPFYLPMLGLIVLFLFSYLSIFPFFYKLEVLTLSYLFTILMPTVLIHMYRRYQGWNLIELGHRERRMVPYMISIVCYFVCIYVMEWLHMPHFMSAIVIAALLVQIVCALINLWWKVSTHTAAIGGVGGALFAFAEYLNFNPVWWLCLIFLVAGLLGTSRMILRQHSLAQVVVGFWVGFLCAAIVVLMI
jgi:membrane-associated phospholipid phosphatase